MTKFQLGLIGALALGGVTISWMIQHQANVQLREKTAMQSQQANRLAGLTAENRKLSNRLAQITNPVSGASPGEMEALRREVVHLRRQTSELAQKKKANQPPEPSSASSQTDTHPPEYYEQMHQLAAAKPRDALFLTSAFRQYAADHQGQSPTNLDQLTSYLTKEQRSLSGTNEFEIVYHGSLDALEKIPLGAVALVRDRQVRQAPNGKMARVYGMAGGTAETVESVDNFQAWEAEHLFPGKQP